MCKNQFVVVGKSVGISDCEILHPTPNLLTGYVYRAKVLVRPNILLRLKPCQNYAVCRAQSAKN